MRPRITLVLPALLGLLACDQAARNIYEQQLFAFGTLVELTLVPEHRRTPSTDGAIGKSVSEMKLKR